jgi:MtrB/PioB family decaheme-associated outer membrane protein
MKMRKSMLIGALLLVSAGIASAQEQQQQTSSSQQVATPAKSFVTPTLGSVDFGFRGDNLEGDEARYNRFRDLRGGGFVDNFRFERETETLFFRAEANNVGYRDQRYFGQVQSIGKLKASFEWNQVPLFISNSTAWLYNDRGNGRLDIDDSVQLALQNAGTVAVRDAAIANALAGATQYDLRSRRDIGNFNLVYSFNRDMDFKFNLKNTNRNGYNLMAFGFGTSPGLLPAVEFGVPTDDRTTDVSGVVEYANAKGLLSFGYEGSWYDNKIPFIQFDNPMRAVDAVSNTSIGQAAMWPTNSSFAVNMNGSYKLAKRTRASVGVSIGRWNQDETLPAMTVNTALVSAPLERATAETKADIKSVVFNFNSRPVNNVWLTARYRYYDYANKTPHFSAENAIIGDWAVTTQHHEIEPSSFLRKNLDLDASFTPFDYLAFGVGYGREDADRTWRIFEKTAEDTFRVTVDSTGNDYFTVRAKYESSSRSGSGFDGHLLDEVGEQPGMRHFDIADRDRTRFTTSFSVTPVSFLNLNAAVGTGKDDYTDTGFGLRDSDNRNWSAGFDIIPAETVTFGFNYGYEKFTANQYSRTANPLSATDQSFNDPTRDWWIDSDDVVKTISASLDMIKTLPRTDIRLSYDMSDGEATYVYGMKPEQKVFTTTPLRQLAPIENRLTGGKADVQYFVRPNIALGVAYWYEDYKVQDFALGDTTLNRLDARNGSTNAFASTFYSGYVYRPYKAHTGWLRMTYLW